MGPPLPFVGRDSALVVLAAAFESAADGRGRVIDITGESGMGKTRLIAEVLARVSNFGLLGGTADPRHTDRTFSALPPVLASVARAASGANRPTPMRILIPEPQTNEAFVALDSVVEEVQKRAAEQPQVVVVDDAQWADKASALALQGLARQLKHEAVVLIVARRPEPCEWSPLLPELDATALVLGPLAKREVADLSTEHCGGEPDTTLREQLERTGGVPFLIGEVLAGYPTGRLSSLDTDAKNFLQIAAILGPTFRATDLGAVAGQTAAHLVAPLNQAIAKGILRANGELCFTHELIRDQLLHQIPESLKRALHMEAAIHLATSGADASVVAFHLLAGDGTIGPETARSLRRVTAELSVHNPLRAIALLRKATDSLPRDSEEWVDAISDLAQALMLEGHLDEAEETALAAMSSPTQEQERHLRQVLVEVRFARGDLPEALRQLERIEKMGGGADGPAEARAARATLRLLTFDLAGARKEALTVIGGSVSSDPTPRSVANMAMSSVEMAEGYTKRAVDFAEDAICDADESSFGHAHMLHPHLCAALAYSSNDQHDAAQEALRTSHEVARQRGTGWEAPLRHGALASEHYRSGRLDDCAAECETGLLISREHGIRLADVLLTSHWALVGLHRGDFDLVESRLAEAEEAMVRLGPRIGSTHFVWAKALHLEATGDLTAARTVLQMAMEFAIAAGVIGRLSTIGPDLARMAVAERDNDVARKLVGYLDELAKRSGAPSVVGAVLRGRAWAFEDAEAAVAAVECFHDCDRALEEARTREDAGRILLLGGSRDAAVVLIGEARAAFETMGATADMQRVDLLDPSRQSPSMAPPTTGWDALTVSEQKVSLLVAEGLSNPDVGERLFISRRTVETHLYRTYSKLQVSSRVELALLVEREGRTSP